MHHLAPVLYGSWFEMMMGFCCVVGFLLCPHQLAADGASDLWKLALQDSYVLNLFRDEYLLIHGIFEKFLQELKTKEWE